MIRDYEKHRLTKRPSKELIERLKTIPVAFISDYMKQIGIVNFNIRGVRPISPMKKYPQTVVGPAVTMAFAPVTEAYAYVDAPFMHTEVVEEAQAGDILILAGGGAPYGFWGDHTTHQAINQKLEAVVIDGYTRDYRPIVDTGFPLFSTGVTYESYVRRWDPVGYNTIIAAGGAQVRPGDVLCGDDDGVCVIPIEVFEKVVEGTTIIVKAEQMLEKAVADGKPWKEIYPEIHRLKYLAPK
jgi:4-hydroxy-4-methyl-2-oxoglutarate aldolase